MVKKLKSSRKGKKAWRANISTADIDNFIEKSTKDALSGGSLAEVPSEALFFIDKSKDLSVRRKIEKQREKVLYCDSILQKNPFVKPLPSSGRKVRKPFKPISKSRAVAPAGKKDDHVSALNIVDIWENEDELKTKMKMHWSSVIPAVEIEPPGCSFNPSFEAHQDSLAQAVADEMHEVYQIELGPEPVPLTVAGSAKIDDEDIYFLDVDNGSEEEQEKEKEKEDLGNDVVLAKRSTKIKKVTRVELNRRARRKERELKEAAIKEKKQVLKEIDGLADIMKQIAKEEEEKHKRRIRKLVAKQERARTCPPRLGKHRFQPTPVQVLLSEEITGSLRQLKGCCTLSRDRFKSLQKRGMVVPTRNSRRY